MNRSKADEAKLPEELKRAGGWERSGRRNYAAVFVLPLLAVAAAAGMPRAAGADDVDPFDLSIEELMQVQVTSVAKTPQRLADAPAAIAVITQEDLRRTGVTTLPDALRLVPGMQVAQVDAHSWAVSARGFNDVFANKLLVMIDGRSVYTPLFSGVFWDVQDAFFEDIERIEVVRGPGGTLWGANAVNGVINIITKSAKETQGGVVTGGAGTEERGFGGVRYGGQFGERAWYRVYGKYFDRDESVLPGGRGAGDAWRMGRGGFRTDWEPNEVNRVTLQGDYYHGELEQTFTNATMMPPYSVAADDLETFSGGNLLGRWSHAFSDESEMQLQTYYDRTYLDTDVLTETRDSGDIDFQHQFLMGERQEMVWGLGYRVSHDDVESTDIIQLDPESRTTQLFSAFVQDEIELVTDRLRLTVGTKIEHNDYTGVEWQPSARLAWKPQERHMVWASVARAVRTPSRAENDVRILQDVIPPGAFGPGMPAGPLPIFISGSSAFESERLVAYELGHRMQLHDRVTVDWAVFYNDYDDLQSMELDPATFQVTLDNGLEGRSYGGELAAHWQAADWWRLSGGYSLLLMELEAKDWSRDSRPESDEDRNPVHQVFVRSSMDFPKDVGLDVVMRYVDGLPDLEVPAYLVADVRLGWTPREDLEVSIVGRNLLDNQHPEFQPTTLKTQRGEVEHSVYGKITWKF